jgi:hypothetical protein
MTRTANNNRPPANNFDKRAPFAAIGWLALRPAFA